MLEETEEQKIFSVPSREKPERTKWLKITQSLVFIILEVRVWTGSSWAKIKVSTELYSL